MLASLTIGYSHTHYFPRDDLDVRHNTGGIIMADVLPSGGFEIFPQTIALLADLFLMFLGLLFDGIVGLILDILFTSSSYTLAVIVILILVIAVSRLFG